MKTISPTKPELYPRESQPFGKSWEEWVGQWWNWCFADPESKNQLEDDTGELSSKYQSDPNVWFLGGTFGGKANRKCILPFGKAILCPLVNDLISFAEYSSLTTREELYNFAKEDIDTMTVISATVDGIRLDDLINYRIQSKLLNLTIPADMPYGEVIVETEAVSDGYWLFLKPLSSGLHTFHIKGEKSLFDQVQHNGYSGESGMFRTEVEYSLTIR